MRAGATSTKTCLSDEGYVLHSAISYGEARGWLQREEIALAIVDLHLISSAAPQDNRDGFWLLARGASAPHPDHRRQRAGRAR